MSDKLITLSEHLRSINGVEIIEDLTISEIHVISGRLSIEVSDVKLDFDIRVQPFYPYQLHENESIRFVNQSLIEYDHVNRDGSICLHTAHHYDLKTKLNYDIESLKRWIDKYYINKQLDAHYPHIIAQPSLINGTDYYFLFTDINGDLTSGDYGKFTYALMSTDNGPVNDIWTYLVKTFHKENSSFGTQSKFLCNWTESYFLGLKESNEGLFVFVDTPPTIHRRFMIENWTDLEGVVSQEFMKYLYDFKHKGSKKEKLLFPLFIGYKIPDGSIHWQVAMLNRDSLPIITEKQPGGGYEGYFIDEKIRWVWTKNTSYKNFFGRGKLHDDLTEKKILIIGLGAIGSIVATTLTRGGCRYIDIQDYDLKEPENVCRSEYGFQSGVRLKVSDLSRLLTEISPFVDVNSSSKFSDFAKLAVQDDIINDDVLAFFNSYDVIIDCSADNDMLSMLDVLKPDALVINISISNKAESLIFGIGPDNYKWVSAMSELLKGDLTDLYEPTGCWSPTFKASYNDVNVLVQYALKQFNLYMVNGAPLRKFYLTTETDQGFTIKLHEF